jgi:hypothetical protein
MDFYEIMVLKSQQPSDINEHLHVLYEYAKKSEVIVELGTRGLISTYSFLAAKPKKLYSVDISRPEVWGCKNFNEILNEANSQGINFVFLQEDSKKVSIEENIDLLFVDTLHTSDQVSEELKNLASKVSKYIIFHDTVLYGFDGYGEKGFEPGNGILKAIDDFLQQNKEWKRTKVYENNNGLTILEKYV